MEASAFTIAIIFLVIVFYGDKFLRELSANWAFNLQDKPTEFPIEYPMEPMFENYDSIKKDIFDCTTTEELKKVYVRIIIFESCYDDSATFTIELQEMYSEQEKILKDYSCDK